MAFIMDQYPISLIDNYGYLIRKDCADEKDLDMILKSDNINVLKNYLHLPRFYGIKKYGKPKIDLSIYAKNIIYSVNIKPLTMQEKISINCYHSLINIGGCTMLAPVGFGKTTISCQIIGSLGVKVLIVVPSNILMYNWSTNIEKHLGIIPSKITGGIKLDIPESNIILILSTFLKDPVKMEKYESLLCDVGLTIVDEVNMYTIKKLSDILGYINSKYVMGLACQMTHGHSVDNFHYDCIGPLITYTDSLINY